MAFALRMLGLAPASQDEFSAKKRRKETDAPRDDKEDIKPTTSKTIPVETQKPRLSPKPKKQRLDSPEESPYANVIIEHTPKKITLGLDFEDEADSECDLERRSLSSDIEYSDLDSLSDLEISLEKDKIPLCRKLSKEETDALVPVKNNDDKFVDLEDHDEEKRASLLLSYQAKIEKMDAMVKKLLSDFQFHIEVSDIFNSKSQLRTLSNRDLNNLPKLMVDSSVLESVSRAVSPTGSWNLVLEKEDEQAKRNIQKQLIEIKNYIEDFVESHLDSSDQLPKHNSTMTDSSKENRVRPKRSGKIRVNRRKYEKKLNDFPDLRETLHNLFALDADHLSINTSVSGNNVTLLMSDVEKDAPKCTCRCPEHGIPESNKSTDSGLPHKRSGKTDSISSSIGDFSLDNSQLTTYSESLEQVLSYNSFNDSNLTSTMLQKSAIERITFYVKVHNIEMRTVDMDSKNYTGNGRRAPSVSDQDFHFLDCEEAADDIYFLDEAGKGEDVHNGSGVPSIVFACKVCNFCTTDERGLYKHILEPIHCEKLHFLYKIAYIRKCFSTGEEIQPSTILNPMTMYRDDNKIVCFGESKFACSLCFEGLIVGEFVLMAHCYNVDHVEKKKWLKEVFDEAGTVGKFSY